MTIKTNATSSLIFYTGKNEAGSLQQVSHGETGELAAGSADWTYQSVAMTDMQTFANSAVNPGDASLVYLGHREDMITVTQDDLTLLYSSSDQFPLNYLGLDPSLAAVVWLDVDTVQAAPNAVAAFGQVGGSTTTLTTLSLPGQPGALGFVGKSAGSAVVATCQYGDYNTSNGTVIWSGTGSLLLQSTGGTFSLTDLGGFPDGWNFSQPKLQPDGSWVVTLEGGIPASDTISSVTANPTSITDDNISSSLIAATVVDGNNQPVSGVDVAWTTTLGSVIPATSTTDTNGNATTTLKDDGMPGIATVTATIADDNQSVEVNVTDSSADYVISDLTSDKDSIANDGSDLAKLTATVKDSAGNVVEGIAVYWSASQGSLNHDEQDTDSNGQSHVKLTDTGDTGKAKIKASLDNGSNMTCSVELLNAVTLKLYCSTGAPLNTGMLAAVKPTNKVALYGTPAATIQLDVTGSAKFKSGDASSVSVTLDSTGYAVAEVYDTLAETVTVSTTVSGTPLSGTMTFTGTSEKGAVYVNNLTPADNKTPGTFYWWDYQGAGVSSVQLSVNGSAHFADNSQSGSFPLSAKGGAVAVNIYDATVETVAATLTPESQYYAPSTENMTFVLYQQEQR